MNNDRRNPILPLDLDALAPFLKGRAPVSVERLSAGKSNTTYKLVLPDETTAAARLYSRPTLKKELWVMDRVRELAPVPRALYVGETLAVFEFAPGVPLRAAPEAVGEAAKTLARIASVGFDAPGDLDGEGRVVPWPFSTEGGFTEMALRDARVQKWLGPERVRALRGAMIDEAERLREISAESRLVHGDFNPDNILVHEGKISAVLDWEFALSGTPYMDIGNLTRELDATFFPSVRQGLAAGGMALPDDWRERAALIDLSSALEFLMSNRSDDFKQSRVEWIDRFLARHKGACFPR